jgi:4-alpha-glucanotransferase
VSADSADVWANPEQFLLDDNGSPSVVAGVPPDYFAADGQHWGNPIYDWDAMAADGFRWWIARCRHALTQCDLLRLDHFRGFAQAWHIPAGEKTARNGTWVDGPGLQLFEALRAGLKGLPFIAEDLGLITEDVHLLRNTLGLPGMAVLQFGFGGDPASPHLPHNYVPHTACYTGTHDNDTTHGWYWTGAGETERRNIESYTGHRSEDPPLDLLRLAWSSVAALAVAPLQDILGLTGEARMNVPGQAAGNWRWRLRPEQFRAGVLERLAEMTVRFGRVPKAV